MNKNILPHLAKQSVLVIDDNSEMLHLGKEILESEGFDVFTADSGLQALEVLAQIDVPNLVLLDMQMGDMSGLIFLEKLEEQRPEIVQNIPIVFYTAFDEVPKSKATGFMRKDGNLDKFISSVHNFIKQGTSQCSTPAAIHLKHIFPRIHYT